MYHHPVSLSPDPMYGKDESGPADAAQISRQLFPYRLVHVRPDHGGMAEQARQWGGRLNLFDDPGPLTIVPDANGRAEIIVDFGTELHGFVELSISAPSLCNVMVIYGEILPEVDGTLRNALYPHAYDFWHISGAGQHEKKFATFLVGEGKSRGDGRRGFRFMALHFYDLPVESSQRLVVNRLCARADFTFTQRRGDLQCSDKLFQQVWQMSVYSARLCTQPDRIWDGIKRDRVGWFGDARIIKQAVDAVFFDPRPSEYLLAAMPADKWANGIPNYTFDGMAMLAQHVLTFGLNGPAVGECYDKMAAAMRWAMATQSDADGFIIRTDGLKYFGDIGFVDWSPMPVGGRFEELCWLQCKYVEGLVNLGYMARTLGRPDDAALWDSQAQKVGRRIVQRFWRDGIGFLHTLNHVGTTENPLMPGGQVHYQRTYVEKVALGPSGPTRQANALAILAGLADAAMQVSILQHVFDDASIPRVITPYFSYYEQSARGLCGDGAGAVRHFRDYIGGMIQKEDAASVWELYDPAVTDMRRYFSSLNFGWTWPLSYCHGWGAGAVPIAQRYLLGVEAVQPGFAAVRIDPALNLGWAFDATLPTPHGPIRVTREDPAGPISYDIPEPIAVDASKGPLPPLVKVSRA